MKYSDIIVEYDSITFKELIVVLFFLHHFFLDMEEYMKIIIKKDDRVYKTTLRDLWFEYENIDSYPDSIINKIKD